MQKQFQQHVTRMFVWLTAMMFPLQGMPAVNACGCSGVESSDNTSLRSAQSEPVSSCCKNMQTDTKKTCKKSRGCCSQKESSQSIATCSRTGGPECHCGKPASSSVKSCKKSHASKCGGLCSCGTNCQCGKLKETPHEPVAPPPVETNSQERNITVTTLGDTVEVLSVASSTNLLHIEFSRGLNTHTAQENCVLFSRFIL